MKLQEIRRYYPDWKYLEIRIRQDNIHFIWSFPPKYAVNKVVKIIKKNTLRFINRKFASLKKVFGGKGYFVSTIGINEEVIQRYVKSQDEEQNKRNLSFESTTSIKVWESIIGICFIGLSGISTNDGLTDYYLEEIEINNLKIE